MTGSTSYHLPLTRISASASMLPSSDMATHVYVADSRMSVSIRMFFPKGMLSSGVISTAPNRQRIVGIGDPIATHVRLTAPPGITSALSGGMEKCGGTRRTIHITKEASINSSMHRTRSFIHPFTQSSIHSFIHSLIRPFICLFVHSLNDCSFIRSFNNSFIHSCIHSCVYNAAFTLNHTDICVIV